MKESVRHQSASNLTKSMETRGLALNETFPERWELAVNEVPACSKKAVVKTYDRMFTRWNDDNEVQRRKQNALAATREYLEERGIARAVGKVRVCKFVVMFEMALLCVTASYYSRRPPSRSRDREQFWITNWI